MKSLERVENTSFIKFKHHGLSIDEVSYSKVLGGKEGVL